MIDVIEKFGEVGKGDVKDPFIPFLPAIESGMLKDPAELAVEAKDSLGVDIANAIIPNAEKRGIVAMGRRIFGIDHVRLRRRGSDKRLIISPTSKSDVTPKGKIIYGGGVTLSSPEGWLKIAGVVLDQVDDYWKLAALGISRGHGSSLPVFRPGIETPQLEIKHVLDGGHLVVGLARRYY